LRDVVDAREPELAQPAACLCGSERPRKDRRHAPPPQSIVKPPKQLSAGLPPSINAPDVAVVSMRKRELEIARRSAYRDNAFRFIISPVPSHLEQQCQLVSLL